MQRGCSIGCINPNATTQTSYRTTCCNLNLCNKDITVPSVEYCYSCKTTSTSQSDSCYAGNGLALQSFACSAVATHCSKLTTSKLKLYK